MALNGWHESTALVASMLRTWQAARSIGENPLPPMRERVPFDPAPELVSACDSLFALTEAVLGRALVPGRCCSATLSRDEAALLAMLRHAPEAGSIATSSIVPHGLPAALQWASFAVMRALGDTFGAVAFASQAPAKCPFDTAIEKAA